MTRQQKVPSLAPLALKEAGILMNKQAMTQQQRQRKAHALLTIQSLFPLPSNLPQHTLDFHKKLRRGLPALYGDVYWKQEQGFDSFPVRESFPVSQGFTFNKIYDKAKTRNALFMIGSVVSVSHHPRFYYIFSLGWFGDLHEQVVLRYAFNKKLDEDVDDFIHNHYENGHEFNLNDRKTLENLSIFLRHATLMDASRVRI